MTNHYLDCVADRMRADNAIEQLHRHWASRAERLVMRLGYLIDLASPRFSHVYTEATGPLVEWLSDRQRAFLLRWF